MEKIKKLIINQTVCLKHMGKCKPIVIFVLYENIRV